jgi:hypothetical protein
MFRKLNPKFLADAEDRLIRLSSISEDLDLGNGLTYPAFKEKIAECRAFINHYNGLIAIVTGERSNLTGFSKELKEWHERMLMGVGLKFGKNSPEYVQAGGKRKEDRKKFKRLPKVRVKAQATL